LKEIFKVRFGYSQYDYVAAHDKPLLLRGLRIWKGVLHVKEILEQNLFLLGSGYIYTGYTDPVIGSVYQKSSK
jgi:hypothetical protein